MKIYLIRHGKTKGNEERKYVGSTDQPLSSIGKEELKEKKATGIYEDVALVFSSPMKRCIQTTEILYPGKTYTVIENLKEYDFGIFEGKGYEELKDTEEYIRYLKSGGNSQIPGTEPLADFQAKCVKAFEEIVSDCVRKFCKHPKDNTEQCGTEKIGEYEEDNAETNNVAIICHGGTIMSIMQHVRPINDFYEYRANNGGGYVLDWSFELNKCEGITNI